MNITDSGFLIELSRSIELFKPETALAITFAVVIILDLIFKKIRSIAGVGSLVGFAITAYFMGISSGAPQEYFSGMLAADGFALFFKYIILISSALIIIFSFFSKELYSDNRSMGEFYSLIVGMTFGMFLLTGAKNLIMVYLALETMSLSSYVLAGYTKEVKRASEASLKYVLFGALSSGIMIYGISLLYGITGSLNLEEIKMFVMSNNVDPLGLGVAGIMIIAGIGYKISAVPFHFWTPDVYEGAPVTITAYLSVASKAAGMALLIRFLIAGFYEVNPMQDGVMQLVSLGGVNWQLLVAILSVLTMTVGNIVAVWQTNVKRILAYSSIAHAGYILMGVAVLTDAGIIGVLVYFFTYMIMNLGAFFVVMLIANETGSEELEDYSGLGYRAPILSACMVVFLISLTGLPPTAGFTGKLFIFAGVLEAGWIWLAVIGIMNSVVSLYYYVKIFRNMYLRQIETTKEKLPLSIPAAALVIIIALATVYFGLFYGPLVQWAEASVKIF